MVKIVPLDNIIRVLLYPSIRQFALILEVWGLGSEIKAFQGPVSSLRRAWALLTLTGWLLVALTTPILAFWAFDNISNREARALIRCGGEHEYPSEVGIQCVAVTNTNTLTEAVIMCDMVHRRDNRSQEGLNWFSGQVINKAQGAGDVDQGVVRDGPKESEAS
ncbi:hypothetical protein D8674_040504 [Pyrus ussuriensis x Pyrus communis]|uniref:Uncharacterized protein n=1 Tax=Pyrus ussuriensis x Pyrus communis TaxID=2448454 RepID=A0A5N5HP96_9ROSA|nr:hypothetical protein D8674_040504 [Pyrus ussuriensis x Pyrus communis]